MRFVAGATSMSISGQCMLQMGVGIQKGMKTESLKPECLAIHTLHLYHLSDADDIELSLWWLTKSKIDVEQCRPPLNMRSAEGPKACSGT